MNDLESILRTAQKCGIAHNNGAGGQYLLCATAEQLQRFALAAQSPAPVAVQPSQWQDIAGWKLVPIEPTREMLRAVTAVVPKGPYDFAVVATWRAMLEAAPPPPLSASPEDKPK